MDMLLDVGAIQGLFDQWMRVRTKEEQTARDLKTLRDCYELACNESAQKDVKIDRLTQRITELVKLNDKTDSLQLRLAKMSLEKLAKSDEENLRSIKMLREELAAKQNSLNCEQQGYREVLAKLDHARREGVRQAEMIVSMEASYRAALHTIRGLRKEIEELVEFQESVSDELALEERVESLEKKIKHRNEVLRDVVDNHREFVAEIKAVANLEGRYGKNCVDPVLAKLSGFRATKESKV